MLVAVGGNPVHSTADVARQMYRSGVWTKLSYTLDRDSVSLDVPVILQPVDKSLNQGLRLIALVYLGIGMYVLLRRWTAPKAGHFYLFCLVSFIFYSFKFTGKLNQFDWTIYWSNVVAGMLQPAMFLHFALSFPERKSFVQNRSWIFPLVYLPGLLMLSLWVLLVTAAEPSGLLLWNLDRMQMGYVAALVPDRDICAVAYLPARPHADPAPADEVGDARHLPGGGPVHGLLRDSLPLRPGTDSGDEDQRALAGVSAADLRLCDCALPADGRGPDLQARHGLHHRCGHHCRSVLCGRRRHGRSCSTRVSPARARAA